MVTAISQVVLYILPMSAVTIVDAFFLLVFCITLFSILGLNLFGLGNVPRSVLPIDEISIGEGKPSSSAITHCSPEQKGSSLASALLMGKTALILGDTFSGLSMENQWSAGRRTHAQKVFVVPANLGYGTLLIYSGCTYIF